MRKYTLVMNAHVIHSGTVDEMMDLALKIVCLSNPKIKSATWTVRDGKYISHCDGWVIEILELKTL